MFRKGTEGMEQYKTYLESEHWSEFSREVRLKRKVCEGCGMDAVTCRKKYGQNLNVHHKSYKNLGHEQPQDVELLCYRCHMEQHGQVGWVDWVQRFTMPEVKSFNPFCANCGVRVMVELWNHDELDADYICGECRDAA